MSRAYRIQVRESLRRIIRAQDGVTTQLEILEILPPEQMADLLTQELQGRGFEQQGQWLVRRQGATTVTVEAATGSVTVRGETAREVQLEAQRHGYLDRDDLANQERSKADLRELVHEDLENQAGQQTKRLERQVTEQLEAQLGDLRQELDQAVNRITAEALKRKAAQLGQIKEMTEDPQTGSLTIVLEV